MTWVLLFLIVVAALLPALLARHRSIERKRLFAIVILVGVIKPLSTILIPFLVKEDGFGSAMDYYLILLFTYYFFIFLVYRLAISLISNLRSIQLTQFIRPKPYKYLVFGFAFLFFAVLVLGSGGTFLTNPREGYQYHREGIGFIWVFYILSIGILYFIYLIIGRPSFIKIIVFSMAMFFSGSKQLILEIFLKSYLVYTWKDIRISKFQLMIVGAVFFMLMLKQFDQFGAEEQFLSRVALYFDFMYHASLVFNDYESGILQYQFGSIFLSSFWRYVPRVVYPEKPYAYGSTSLVEMYFPGLAETGHTPSFGMLTAEFVDFGWLAPVFAILLNLETLIQILSLVIVTSMNTLNQRLKIGALAFVLIPGFGFHLPLPITLTVAYFILPSMIRRYSS